MRVLIALVRSIWEHPIARAGVWLAQSCVLLWIAYWGLKKYARVLDPIYPIKDWLFWRILPLWLWGGLLAIACVSFGILALRRWLGVTDRPVLETLVTAAALGLVGFTIGMYVGGALRFYRAWFAVALPLGMIAGGAAPTLEFARAAWAKRSRRVRKSPLSVSIALAAALWGLVCVVFVYLELFTPDAINFDAAWCHMPIAQDYARAHGIIPFVADYARCVPHLASIVHTWAFIVPGLSESQRYMLALHNEFFFFLWTLAGVGAAVQYLLDDDTVRGGWAAFFLFPAIFVYDSNIGGAADHYLAFFAAPLLIATARAARRMDRADCVLVGVFAAGAILTKYQGAYLLATSGGILGVAWARLAVLRILDARRGVAADAPAARAPSWRSLLVGPALLVGVGALVASPHFIKNWVFYHNPTYPFMLSTFKHSRPTTANAAYLFEYLFKDWNWRPHGETFRENFKDALELTYTFSFEPHYSFTKNVPNFGSLFTLCLPMLLVVRGSKRLWIGALIGWGSILLWAMTFRVDRNLQGFVPILAAVTAGILLRAWSQGWLVRLGLVPLVCLQIIWGGDAMVYSGYTRLRAALDLIKGGYDGHRGDRLDYRKEFRALGKALPPKAKILLHETRANLGINREILLDWAGQQGLIQYEGLRGPRAVYDYYQSIGITHILHVPGRRPAQTKMEEVLFSDFIKNYATNSKRYGSYELFNMPTEPPPPDPHYLVLAIGIWGYKDGLYPVETMNTYEALPRHLVKFPKPATPLPADAAGALALVNQASAAVVGARAKPLAEIAARLQSDFVQGTSYGRSFVVHLRKHAGTPASASPAEPAHPRASDPGEPEDEPVVNPAASED